MSKCDTDSDGHFDGHTVCVTIVSASDHPIDESGDHSVELGFVQQRDRAHGQQLLESVQHADICRRSAVRRNLSVLRGRIGQCHAIGHGALVYEHGSTVPGWDTDPDSDCDGQCDGSAEWNGGIDADNGDGASWNA